MKTITIFGREGCGFCRRAVELCEIRQLRYRYMIFIEKVSAKLIWK